ncbi:hypothetical protein HNY73_017781 [Argiope bruennichi]|uniref:Uncharacterized protein n=1 Tax=Argiope bruennichi TaxID=94029 RepID=A0A8T0EET9_ARGBR|nr:hypothetical protein HNY73_017781 [Argiope bruennichi]
MVEIALTDRRDNPKVPEKYSAKYRISSKHSSMSSEDAPSPSTYRDHLLSRSLFRELFRHNLVGPDGRMKDNPDNMKKYLSFLEKMAAERRTALYEKRILKRDLKVLDDWLEEISTPFAKVVQIRPYKPCLTWKEFQRNHHARVKKRRLDADDENSMKAKFCETYLFYPEVTLNFR